MNDEIEASFKRCDLCGEHHETLIGESEGECPEAWAVEYLKQYEKMYIKWTDAEKKLKEANKRIDELKQENQKLREALEFYADKDNWIVNNTDFGLTLIEDDGGARAILALEGTKGGEGSEG